MSKQQAQKQAKESVEFPFFYAKDGNVPFWDDPTVEGHRNIPLKYRPVYSLEGTLNLERRGLIDEKGLYILKVLGDAVCANEDQLRRYLKSIMTNNQTSSTLQLFGNWGMVDRWKLVSHLRDVQMTAPFTLGYGAYRYLKYFYPSHYFIEPDHWDYIGINGIQRYVSLNELRCQLFERKKLKGWTWQPIINNNPQLQRPMGVAEVDTGQGIINLMMIRPQMGLDYLTHVLEILEIWERVYQAYGRFPLRGIPFKQKSVVVIYASTQSLMKEIHQHMDMKNYHYPIWFCSEEDVYQDLATSFYTSDQRQLKRISLDFLNKEVME